MTLAVPRPLPSGVLEVSPGKYRLYRVEGGVIAGHSVIDTEGFRSAFDSMDRYDYPSQGTSRLLVRLSEGERSGWWFHPHQLGVTETHGETLDELPDEIRPAGETVVVDGEMWHSSGARWIRSTRP